MKGFSDLGGEEGFASLSRSGSEAMLDTSFSSQSSWWCFGLELHGMGRCEKARGSGGSAVKLLVG